LGINNILGKICSYSCVYCQVGRTLRTEVERISLYEPEELVKEVEGKLERTREIGQALDYLTFVADGEPTLDLNLGRVIELIQPLGIKIAVITNGSLIPLGKVREDLEKADWLSLKVDCTREQVWRRMNRPKPTLRLDAILGAMLEFARVFTGDLVTETMLVRGLNDERDCLREVADFLAQLQPAKAYVSIPTRPPAEKWVEPTDEEGINRAYQIFTEQLETVECLIGYEGSEFTVTGNPTDDILSITAVHPMREDALEEFLLQAKADWSIIEGLLKQGRLIELNYRKRRFYMRRLSSRRG
jgi:wyosine [tRNA(Phe)-imidazoG37] synthetase (radical SAM superfamily)